MDIKLKSGCTNDKLKQFGFEEVYECTDEGESIKCYSELRIKKFFYNIIVDVDKMTDEVHSIGVQFKEPKTKLGKYILYHFRLGRVNSKKIEKQLLRLDIFEKVEE